MKVSRIRDLSLIEIDKECTMVIACDSCGGIGMKEGDAFKVPPFYVGKFTVRVALMEVLCSGAEVITVTDAVCNEMNTTGEEIIKGIKEELKEASIEDIVLTGSTEENFKTSSTGLGVTVIGIAGSSNLKVNRVKDDALIISVGIPKVGDEINLNGDSYIVNYLDIGKLLKEIGVYEIVPVGSKGIEYEANLLAENNNMILEIEENINVDVKKTGGPATCVIAAVIPEVLRDLQDRIENINIIGYLKKR